MNLTLTNRVIRIHEFSDEVIRGHTLECAAGRLTPPALSGQGMGVTPGIDQAWTALNWRDSKRSRRARAADCTSRREAECTPNRFT
ncbi:MAG: hypothetical protein RLZZ182_866 [Pseudomonadota bacterium]